MMRRSSAWMVLAVLAITATAGSAAAADEAAADSTTAIDSGVPRMHGHRFVPAPLVRTPFIHSFLRNTLGMASASDVETPPIYLGNMEDPVPGLKGDLKAALLVFEYQLALKRWLAIRAQLGIGGKFGTGVQTLLAEGVATTMDFEFGWLFNLRRGERTRLSGSLDITNRTVSTSSVYNLVSAIADSTNSNYGLTQSTPVLRGTAGLQFSWAISPLVGLTASAAGGNGDRFDRSQDSAFYYRAGLALSFDLDRYGLPLCLALSGASDSYKAQATNDGGSIWETGIRVSYVGRDVFLISVDLSRAQVPTSDQLEAFNATWLGFSLRYFF